MSTPSISFAFCNGDIAAAKSFLCSTKSSSLMSSYPIISSNTFTTQTCARSILHSTCEITIKIIIMTVAVKEAKKGILSISKEARHKHKTETVNWIKCWLCESNKKGVVNLVRMKQ